MYYTRIKAPYILVNEKRQIIQTYSTKPKEDEIIETLRKYNSIYGSLYRYNLPKKGGKYYEYRYLTTYKNPTKKQTTQLDLFGQFVRSHFRRYRKPKKRR